MSGRMSMGELAGHVIALVSSLDHEMAALTVEGISDRLGVSSRLAEDLLSSLRAPTDDANMGYPVYVDDEGRTILPYLTSLHGRPLRLTEAESGALAAALSAVGVAEASTLRQKVASGFMAPGFDQEMVDRLFAAGGTTRRAERALACSEAAQRGRRIVFPYPTRDGSGTAMRTVDPHALRTMSGNWYLDGFDLDRGAMRTFALDKMGDVEMTGPAEDHAEALVADDGRDRLVRLTFADRFFLDLFEWPGIEVVSEGEVVEAQIEYWGGDWLPKRIAACGGSVTCDDADIMAEARAIAARLLG